MERVLTCDCGFEVHADDEAEFVAGHRPTVFDHEIGKDDSTLPAGQAMLVDQDRLTSDRDAPRERDPESQGDLALVLPGAFPHLSFPS